MPVTPAFTKSKQEKQFNTGNAGWPGLHKMVSKKLGKNSHLANLPET